MFQKCPVCNGDGVYRPNDSLGLSALQKCPTCEGKRIIDTVTGLPPSYDLDKRVELVKDDVVGPGIVTENVDYEKIKRTIAGKPKCGWCAKFANCLLRKRRPEYTDDACTQFEESPKQYEK